MLCECEHGLSTRLPISLDMSFFRIQCYFCERGQKQQLRMYYRSGTGVRCCIGMWQTIMFIHQVAALLCVTLRYGLLPSWKCAVKLKIWIGQSMHIYLGIYSKNN